MVKGVFVVLIISGSILFSQLLRGTSACNSNAGNVGLWFTFTSSLAAYKSHPVLIFVSKLCTVIPYYSRTLLFGILLITIALPSLYSACLIKVICFELRFRNRKQRVLGPAGLGPEGLPSKATQPVFHQSRVTPSFPRRTRCCARSRASTGAAPAGGPETVAGEIAITAFSR